MEVESNDFNIFNVKREVINNIEGLLEEKTVKQEKDIPEYVNVNSFSKVKIESEVPGDSQEIFQCSQCPNKYKKNHYLSIHEVVHDPQRFCTICYVTFTCKKKLGQHLNQHIRDQMKEDKKLAYSCAYCEKYFNSKRKFTLHMRVHTNERPHKCEICGEGFKQLGTLKDHYITHTKEKTLCL
ncbi:hypothetical protein NQ314_013631 [Rhamnusium bicolor]|uniref:C2H2-type domain-containing protein n=1 Tax=Rhamnusium bicolor TaxID=1586634 RepID=A0AAV8X6D7_9CUCU|nr:hypothetical protein NQ314_013631 [Rhamnusium bicolor]